MAVHIKTAQEIETMRIAGRLAAEVLDYIEPYVVPGVTTGELDELCHHYMVDVQKNDTGAAALCTAWLQPLPEIYLHLCESSGVSWCPGR